MNTLQQKAKFDELCLRLKEVGRQATELTGVQQVSLVKCLIDSMQLSGTTFKALQSARTVLHLFTQWATHGFK